VSDDSTGCPIYSDGGRPDHPISPLGEKDSEGRRPAGQVKSKRKKDLFQRENPAFFTESLA